MTDDTRPVRDNDIDIIDDTDGAIPEQAVVDLSSDAVTPAPAKTGPPKRPPSAYFLFSASRRAHYKALLGHSVVEIAKAIGAEWSTLPADDKAVFVADAARLKEEFQRSFNGDRPPQTEARGASALTPAFPLARVRHLMMCDPDTKRTSKPAAVALTKAAELFVAQLAAKCHRVCALAGRRTVRMSDLIIVGGDGQLEFMRHNMAALAKEFDADREAKKERDRAEAHENEDETHSAPDENGDSSTANDENIGDTARDVTRKRVRANPVTDGKGIRRARATIDTSKFANIATMFKQQKQHSKTREHSAHDADDDDDDVVEHQPKTRNKSDSDNESDDNNDIDNDDIHDDADHHVHVQEDEIDDDESFNIIDRRDRRTFRTNRTKRLAVDESDNENDDDADLSVVVRDGDV